MSAIRWVDPRDGVEVELVEPDGRLVSCAGCRYCGADPCPNTMPIVGAPRCGDSIWRPVAAPATTAAPAMHRSDAPAPTVEQIMAAIDGCEASRDEIREMLTAALVAAGEDGARRMQELAAAAVDGLQIPGYLESASDRIRALTVRRAGADEGGER